MLDLKPYSPEHILNLEGLPSEPYAVLFAYCPGAAIRVEGSTFTADRAGFGDLVDGVLIERLTLIETMRGWWLCGALAQSALGTFSYERCDYTPLQAVLSLIHHLRKERIEYVPSLVLSDKNASWLDMVQLPQKSCLCCHGTGWSVKEWDKFDLQSGRYVNRYRYEAVCPDCKERHAESLDMCPHYGPVKCPIGHQPWTQYPPGRQIDDYYEEVLPARDPVWSCGECDATFEDEAGVQKHITTPDEDGELHDGTSYYRIERAAVGRMKKCHSND